MNLNLWGWCVPKTHSHMFHPFQDFQGQGHRVSLRSWWAWTQMQARRKRRKRRKRRGDATRETGGFLVYFFSLMFMIFNVNIHVVFFWIDGFDIPLISWESFFSFFFGIDKYNTSHSWMNPTWTQELLWAKADDSKHQILIGLRQLHVFCTSKTVMGK